MAAAFSAEDQGSAALGTLLAGVAAIVLGFYRQGQGKPVYSVELATSGGNVQAVTSANRSEIETIVRALNEAIAARG